MSRDVSEHNGPRVDGSPVQHARVRFGNNGSAPPVHIVAQDNRAGNIYIEGYLTIEAAELLRRALNDVLGPRADAATEKQFRARMREELREVGILLKPED